MSEVTFKVNSSMCRRLGFFSRPTSGALHPFGNHQIRKEYLCFLALADRVSQLERFALGADRTHCRDGIDELLVLDSVAEGDHGSELLREAALDRDQVSLNLSEQLGQVFRLELSQEPLGSVPARVAGLQSLHELVLRHHVETLERSQPDGGVCVVVEDHLERKDRLLVGVVDEKFVREKARGIERCELLEGNREQ